jgi:hypothetical protein
LPWTGLGMVAQGTEHGEHRSHCLLAVPAEACRDLRRRRERDDLDGTEKIPTPRSEPGPLPPALPKMDGGDFPSAPSPESAGERIW